MHPLIPVKIKKLANFKGELPQYQSTNASGFDIRAQLETSTVIKQGERAMIPTGLSFEIPPGYELQARPRSGLAWKHGLTIVNTPGTIDADYRGEVKILLLNHGEEPIEIRDQERVAQCVLAPVIQAVWIETQDLTDTDRGAGGFGSTGKS
jgi:dUTP pyrophosphatase